MKKARRSKLDRWVDKHLVESGQQDAEASEIREYLDGQDDAAEIGWSALSLAGKSWAIIHGRERCSITTEVSSCLDVMAPLPAIDARGMSYDEFELWRRRYDEVDSKPASTWRQIVLSRYVAQVLGRNNGERSRYMEQNPVADIFRSQ